VNLWMKRAIGVAALGGGLLALSAGAASAQEVSADARLGRPTSAEVRVCADGRVLARLLSCSDPASGTVRVGRDGDASGIRAKVRLPRGADADVSIGTRRSRPGATASGEASAAQRARADAAADTSPRADATASLSRSRNRRLLAEGPLASLAGVGLLGSSPFTLVGDPATDNLLPTGELTLDGLAGEAPAGIGVVDSGPIASGNQVNPDAGDVSPSVPVTVCGNGVGVLGDASADCGPSQPSDTSPAGSGSAGSTGTSGISAGTGDPLLADLGSGNQVDAGIGEVSPSVPVTVCGNSVGLLGDASSNCGTTGGPAPTTGTDAGASVDLDAILDLNTDTSGTTDPGAGVGIDAILGLNSGATGPGTDAGASINLATGTSGSTEPDPGAGVDALLELISGAAGPVSDGGTNVSLDTGTSGTSGAGADSGVGVDLGVLDVGVGGDISTGGIIAPTPPGTTPGTTPGRTDTVGTPGSGSTGTPGIPGTQGLTPGSDAIAFAPLRPSIAGSGALPFTGAGSDLLALFAAGLLAVGALFVRATRPAAATEGGGDR
jgi:hypothetical protein